jgi:ribosomal-protein-alanine N-acetyltransferase
MMVALDVRVRPALSTDRRQISNLMQYSPSIHRHLDWRYPLDWIGSSPFYLLEKQDQIISAMACPPDPPSVAWLRLFINSGMESLEESWRVLWAASRTELASRGRFLVAAIVLQDWLKRLLVSSGFVTRQSIVMLERESREPLSFGVDGFLVRTMLQHDLPEVAVVDSAAFDILWQNSLHTLERAYPQAVIATVAEVDGRVIGYQISTRSPVGAHLARLAVSPDKQGRGIGHALLADLVQKADRHGMYHLTVNTQDDNLTSLALYLKSGFRETGERYPVYQLQIPG